MTRVCPICDRTTDQRRCPHDGSPTVDPSLMEPGGPEGTAAIVRPGVILGGRYRVERHLASGAMGAVFVATQLSMDREVALKVLPREMNLHRERIKRFFREARAASRLTHPHIVRALDFGIDEHLRLPYLVMDFVQGRPLDALLDEDGPAPQRRAVVLLLQLARALAAAHGQGVIHRDLKPSNLLVRRLPDGSEHLQVLDFGIAKMTGAAVGGDPSLTEAGRVVGTPEYMSPEQIHGQEIDGRADLYALGCVAHDLLTGEPPFSGETTMTLLMAHLNHTPLELPARDVHGRPLVAELRALVNALLAKDPDARPADASVVAGTLQDILLTLDSSTRHAAIAPPAPASTAGGGSPGDTELAAPAPDPAPGPTRPLQPAPAPAPAAEVPTRRRRWAWLGAVGAALLAVVALYAQAAHAPTAPPPAPPPTDRAASADTMAAADERATAGHQDAARGASTDGGPDARAGAAGAAGTDSDAGAGTGARAGATGAAGADSDAGAGTDAHAAADGDASRDVMATAEDAEVGGDTPIAASPARGADAEPNADPGRDPDGAAEALGGTPPAPDAALPPAPRPATRRKRPRSPRRHPKARPAPPKALVPGPPPAGGPHDIPVW